MLTEIKTQIGARTSTGTIQQTGTLDLSQFDPEKQDKILAALAEKGLYSVLAAMKHSISFEHEQDYRDWFSENVSNDSIVAELFAVKTRGRAVSYSQAERMSDAKLIEQLQNRVINHAEPFLFTIPQSPEFPFSELVRNKNGAKLHDVVQSRLNSLRASWDKMNDWQYLEADEKHAMKMLRDYCQF